MCSSTHLSNLLLTINHRASVPVSTVPLSAPIYSQFFFFLTWVNLAVKRERARPVGNEENSRIASVSHSLSLSPLSLLLISLFTSGSIHFSPHFCESASIDFLLLLHRPSVLSHFAAYSSNPVSLSLTSLHFLSLHFITKSHSSGSSPIRWCKLNSQQCEHTFVLMFTHTGLLPPPRFPL